MSLSCNKLHFRSNSLSINTMEKRGEDEDCCHEKNSCCKKHLIFKQIDQPLEEGEPANFHNINRKLWLNITEEEKKKGLFLKV